MSPLYTKRGGAASPARTACRSHLLLSVKGTVHQAMETAAMAEQQTGATAAEQGKERKEYSTSYGSYIIST